MERWWDEMHIRPIPICTSSTTTAKGITWHTVTVQCTWKYTFLVMEEKVRLLNITFRVLDSPTKRCLMKASAQSTLKKSMGEGSFFLKKKSHRGRTFFLEWQSKLLSTWKGHLKPSWFLLHFLASILSSVAFLLKGGLSRCFHEMYISVGLSKLLSASKGNLLGFPFKWKGSLDCLSRKKLLSHCGFSL